MTTDRILSLARQHLANGNIEGHRRILEAAIRAAKSARQAHQLAAALAGDRDRHSDAAA